MAKNFKNLNSKEKHEFLFDEYRVCEECEKMKTNNCFLNRETFKLEKNCKTCRNRLVRKQKEIDFLTMFRKSLEEGSLKDTFDSFCGEE